MRLQKLTGAAAALTLAAGVAQAAPFRIVTDEPGSVWVLDAGSGALTRCTTRAAVGAKVVDVFGASGEARPQTAHLGRTECTAGPCGRGRPAREPAQGDPAGAAPARSPTSTAFRRFGTGYGARLRNGLWFLDGDQRRLAGEGRDGAPTELEEGGPREQGHQERHHRHRRPDVEGGRAGRGRDDQGDRREPEGRRGDRRHRRLRHPGRDRPAHPSRDAVHGDDGGGDLRVGDLRRRLGRDDDARRLRAAGAGREPARPRSTSGTASRRRRSASTSATTWRSPAGTRRSGARWTRW